MACLGHFSASQALHLAFDVCRNRLLMLDFSE